MPASVNVVNADVSMVINELLLQGYDTNYQGTYSQGYLAAIKDIVDALNLDYIDIGIEQTA